MKKLCAILLIATISVTAMLPVSVFAEDVSYSENFDAAGMQGLSGFWALKSWFDVQENKTLFTGVTHKFTENKAITIGGTSYNSITSQTVQTTMMNSTEMTRNGQIGPEANWIAIENGRLKVSILKNESSAKELQNSYLFKMKFPGTTTGIVKLSFDLELSGTYTGMNNQGLITILADAYYDGFREASFPSNSGSLYFTSVGRTSPGWNGGTAHRTWGSGPEHFDVVFDYDNNVVKTYINNLYFDEAPFTHNGNLNYFRITPREKLCGDGNNQVHLYFDNIVITAATKGTHTSNVANGAGKVAKETTPAITFSEMIGATEAAKLELYKDGVKIENPAYTMADAEGQTTVTFTQALDYSAEYEIKVPSGMLTTKLVPVTTGSYKFRTEHEPSGITVDSENLPAVTQNAAYTATATLTNTGDAPKQVIYIVALYDASNRMVDIDLDAYQLAAGQQRTFTVDFSANSESGITAKSFICESLQTMKLINPYDE